MFQKTSFQEHFCSTYVLGADNNEDDDRHVDHHEENDGDDHYHEENDDDNYHEDNDDYGCDLKSEKLFTPQHCCEDISRSQDTLTYASLTLSLSESSLSLSESSLSLSESSLS